VVFSISSRGGNYSGRKAVADVKYCGEARAGCDVEAGRKGMKSIEIGS
jgi:hypothetical protein